MLSRQYARFTRSFAHNVRLDKHDQVIRSLAWMIDGLMGPKGMEFQTAQSLKKKVSDGVVSFSQLVICDSLMPVLP
jgi:hypothetical protein